jgi:hypothetical protein
MARFKPSILSGAGGAALLAGLLMVACAHDKGGQVADAGGAPIPDRPDWNWDVRPILSQNCFACHGQGTQKAGLRLDIEKAAYSPIPEDKNKRALVPGNINKSELYKRITSDDADFRMPPKDSHKTLSPRDIAVIEKWIKQGAHYKQHWAYIQPTIVKPEKTKWDKQAVNPIDRYIYARLAKEGLSPSPEADRETLINRVYLDLTGLPPTLAEVDAFVASKDPDAYEHIVDKLLASKEYAERQTNVWLDAARYADSRGGLNDSERPISYPYRDWVISAFERNLPYDKFVTWQLAGDKLNNNQPTREQLLATAFMKEGRQDSEGGSIDEEYRINYVQERTELIGKDFLGLTVGCAKCHNHKYDVIAQSDYYSLSGIFNQMDDRGGGSGNRGTVMGTALEWPTALQTKKIAFTNNKVAAAQQAYQNALKAAQQRVAAQIDAVPAAQRGAFIKTSIDADTQAYYPLDEFHKGVNNQANDRIYIDEQLPTPGTPITGKKTPYDNMTRAQATAVLQKKILADIASGKPTPMFGSANILDAAASKATGGKAVNGSTVAIAGAAVDSEDMKAPGAGGKPSEHHGKPGMAKPGLDKAAAGKGDMAKAGKPGMIKTGLGGGAKAGAGPGGKPKKKLAFTDQATRKGGAGMASDIAAHKADPGLPWLASHEVDAALEQLVVSGYTDDRLGDPQRVTKRQILPGLKEDQVGFSNAGVPGAEPALVNNVKFVPGHNGGQAILMHDSVFSADPKIGQFERTQPYSLDFWIKLPAKPYYDSTRPNGPSASILYNNGGVEGLGYELSLSNNKLAYSITHNAPTNMLLVETKQDVPTGRWVHVTSTYDGNSKAAGMHIYIDGKSQDLEVDHDGLTRSAFPRGRTSYFGSYFGLASGTNFNRPEIVGAALDDVRVVTRALTPIEVNYLQNPNSVVSVPTAEARAEMIQIAAQKDPAVQKAWQDLTDARLAAQRVETPVLQVMVAGDQPVPRKNFVLDRGVYNAYLDPVKPQALPRVFPWSDKLPRDRLGLAEWLFDPKHPLTSRVYVNRMWQNHFGTGIVQTVDDFGTQGTNPTNPELLDYLAVEFVQSGWDIKHMQKLMVMSATYRQNSNVSREALEKDPPNFLLERGPRFRMPAEVLRDNALQASGLLVKHVGGDAVFPYAPDAIWDGAAQGAVVYPTNVPADENHRRSMYTYIKRNAPVANLVPFDMPDRYNATVYRPISNTPLQALVMLNDTQFIEAYRKLAERAIKASANPDEQLTTLFRLAVRRHPTANEMASMRRFRASETAWMGKSPDEVKKLLTNGVAPADPSVDPVQLAAMTVVTAGVMNTPDAYTLR